MKEFLPAAGRLVQQYSKRYVPQDCDSKGDPKKGTWRHETRLEKNGRTGLHHDLNAAFGGANTYRHQRVHRWGIPTRSGQVPGPGYVRAWINKGLGELARTDEKRLKAEFVGALPQARRDLVSIETILNEVWDMVLKELADFKYSYSQRAYEKSQKPTKRDTIPSWWTPPPAPVSSCATLASGSYQR